MRWPKEGGFNALGLKVLPLVLYISAGINYQRAPDDALVTLHSLLAAVVAVGIWWRRQRWAYYGFMLLSAYTVVMIVVTRSFLPASLLATVLWTVYLYKRRSLFGVGVPVTDPPISPASPASRP